MIGGDPLSPARTPLLSLSEVSVRFGPRAALRAVDLEVRSGEFVALTGPNGSGKTTLLRVALGLLPPTEGKAKLHGDPVTGLSIPERALRVAWLPQEERPMDDVSVEDYVLYGRNPHLRPFSGETPTDRDISHAAIESVGLSDRRDSGVLELSGGERQRVLLARALAQETRLLLLDEPTAHLDIAFQLDLLHRVRRLCEDGTHAAVAALHDLNLAARFADRVVVLSRGRLVVDGPPRDVLSEELFRTVWGVSGELRVDARTGIPFLLPRLTAETTASRRAAGTHLAGPIHVVGGGGAAAPIFQALSEDGFTLSASPLNLLDTDAQAADELGIPYPAEVPFAPLGETVRARHRELLERAVAIVVAPFAVGPSNVANLEDLRPYVPAVPAYILSADTIRGRDFSGGDATRATEALVGQGAVGVEGIAEVRKLLRALVPELGSAPRAGASPVGPPRATPQGEDR